MADNPQTARPRPLSPFMTIYHWPASMAASIIHRVTGVGITFAMAILAWWLMAAATGPEAYAQFASLAVLPIGQVILFLCALGLIYHFLAGIRHLVWDIGYGYTPAVANWISVAIFLLAILGAIGLFALVYTHKGFVPV